MVKPKAGRACVSPCALMLSLIYIERLRSKDSQFLHQISSTDLFLVSMMVASKYLFDEGIDEEVFNDEWSVDGDLEVADLNAMERDFLTAMDWKLYASAEDFFTVLERYEKEIARKETSGRGSVTYTDLWVLSRDLDLRKFYGWIVKEMSKVLSVCTLAYLSGVATLLGSVITLSCLRTHVATGDPSCLATTTNTLETNSNFNGTSRRHFGPENKMAADIEDLLFAQIEDEATDPSLWIGQLGHVTCSYNSKRGLETVNNQSGVRWPWDRKDWTILMNEGDVTAENEVKKENGVNLKGPDTNLKQNSDYFTEFGSVPSMTVTNTKPSILISEVISFKL